MPDIIDEISFFVFDRIWNAKGTLKERPLNLKIIK